MEVLTFESLSLIAQNGLLPEPGDIVEIYYPTEHLMISGWYVDCIDTPTLSVIQIENDNGIHNLPLPFLLNEENGLMMFVYEV